MFDDAVQVDYGRKLLGDALEAKSLAPDRFELTFEQGDVELPHRYGEQCFRLAGEGNKITVTAATPVGALYGLVALADRVRDDDPELADGGKWEFADGPAMKYRGHALGLQKPVAHFPDHRGYDWPITREHFPWFYDREHMLTILDRLARHRANVLYFWSGHPFASLLTLDAYPEMSEVDPEQLEENMRQFHWLCSEAERRGIWIVLKFYNIHMSDPLAKSRGWALHSGEAHEEICDYTRAVLAEFVRKYPSVGLMACMGECLRPADKPKWLNVILTGILEGLGPNPETYPPVIIRAHSCNLPSLLPDGQKLYPNIVTMMKHNNESFIATKPHSGNTPLARQSGCHIVNVHLCANIEPFAWGSPRFIRRTCANIVRFEAHGVHVYPLRYWDWPNSSHVEPVGDQLHEHFVWWSAWGRYSWNPWRDDAAEDTYWQRELGEYYELDDKQSAALLDALQESSPVLTQIAGQFIITSGNGQCVNLGQFLVPLAFSRQEFQDGEGYSMGQMCGFPLIGETMWSASPITRMNRMISKCDAALQRISEAPSAPMLDMLAREIEVMKLLAEFYSLKAQACAKYFQVLYGYPEASETDALATLEESLAVYRTLAAKTAPLFRDASCLHHYRRMPLHVQQGYLHWTDCLPEFEREAEIARDKGIRGLLEWAAERAKPANEWNAGDVVVDEV